VDRALWLLLELRTRAWVRRLVRMLGTARGILFFVVGSLFVCLWLGSLLWQFQPVTPEHLAAVRRYGPLGLISLFLVNLVFSTGERAIAFSPAEVNFLFPAPLTRRQLLAYKLTGFCGAAVLSALFMTLFLRQHCALFVAGFVGLALTLLFMQLLSMFLALVASAVGARAYDRRRKLVLLVVLVVMGIGIFQGGVDVLRRDWQDVLAGVEQSSIVQGLLTPLRWFVQAFTAARIWPDLVQWSALALLVNCCLIGLVFALDAHYLEAAAAASEKLYARLQRARRGGAGLVRVRFSLPGLPRWGGIGPLAWRQLTTAVRAFWTFVILLILFAFFMAPMLAQAGKPGSSVPAGAVAGFVAAITFFASPLLPFDFRGDLDRMDVLKALPLPAWRIVLGQLLAPVLLIVLFQWLVLAIVQFLEHRVDGILLALSAFLLPVNVLLFAIENLFFLWFPTRIMIAASDFQSLGRMMLLWIAKVFTLLVTLGAAALAGLAAYVLTGESWTAALAAAWLVVVAAGVGMILLVALAFRQFDVAGDVPP